MNTITEKYVDVSVWDDQVGSWFDLTQVATLEAAQEKVDWYRQQDVRDGYEKRRYQIRVIEEITIEPTPVQA